MTDTTTQTQTVRAAYLQQRDARKRCTFGKVWKQHVLDGKVTDVVKLVEHGVKLKAGRRYDLKKLKFETLLSKVQAALKAEAEAEKAE